MPASSSTEADNRKRLVALMTRHQRQIFAYIYTLVPDRHDAEDLLQETSVVICEKFDEFTAGTDFVAWACQIAWWRIRYSRQKFARAKVVFDDEVLAAVAQTGRLDAGDAPYGTSTTWRSGVGAALLLSLTGARQMLRIEFGAPLDPMRGQQRTEWRFVYSDFTTRF